MLSIDQVTQQTNFRPSTQDTIFRVKWSTGRSAHYSLVVRSCTTRECRWEKTGKLCPSEVDIAINEYENGLYH